MLLIVLISLIAHIAGYRMHMKMDMAGGRGGGMGGGMGGGIRGSPGEGFGFTFVGGNPFGHMHAGPSMFGGSMFEGSG